MDLRRHFWVADNGTVFDSHRQLVTDVNDPVYSEYAAGKYPVTPWPRNDAGVQTYAELQGVLQPYGIFVDLIYYAGHARDVKYAGGITVSGLPFSTDPITLGALSAARLYTIDSDADSFSWKLRDGSFVTLTAAQIKEVQSALAAFDQACTACEDQTITSIEQSIIKTRDQVDAAFASVPVAFTSAAPLTARHTRAR
jgi:hypothetical protein